MIHYAQNMEDVPVVPNVVVVGEMTRYRGQLTFDSMDPYTFNNRYNEYVSRYGVLTSYGSFDDFTSLLEADGWDVFVLPSAKGAIEWHERWIRQLEVDGITLVDKSTGNASSLHPYQQFGLQKALSESPSPKMYGSGFFFFNWGTGTGKTVAACAGAQELFNRNEIDIVLIFTLRQVKLDFTRFANTATSFRAVLVDAEKEKRRKIYEAAEYDAYVLNYEKARKAVDLDLLLKLISGKRVLFIFDEVQKVLNNNTARDGIDKLLFAAGETKRVWPLSASIIDGDPERYHKIFDWMKKNPLGTLKQFRDDYVASTTVKNVPRRTKDGYRFTVKEVTYNYNMAKLAEIRHRVDPWTHVVRKTDPGVRDFFKGLTFVEVPVEMSREDRRIYETIVEDSKEVEGVSLPHYQALRYTCLGLESHVHANNPLSEELRKGKIALSNKTCAKLERMLDDVEDIVAEGDKLLIFTHYTNLSLLRIAEELRRRNIDFVQHYGGQTNAENEHAKSEFANGSVQVFLTSDAGSHGLNCPQARYVLSFDVPYSYDTLMQRNDRIDRADSWLSGLEARVYFYEDTVEERIWKINNQRRITASHVQGTDETFTREGGRDDTPDTSTMEYLMYGKTSK